MTVSIQNTEKLRGATNLAHKIMVGVQKGGTGKTVTTVVLAEILAAAGYKTLILDLDSQGNATQMTTQKSIYSFSENTILEAIREKDPEKYVVHAKEGIDLIPADDMLVTFSRYIYKDRVMNPVRELENTIKLIEHKYDFILMDCPPALSDITLNALVYCDYIIVPIQMDAFGKDALDRFIDFVNGAKTENHTHADILGILVALKDNRSNIEKAVCANIRSKYKDLVFNTEIKRRAKLKEYTLTGARMKKKEEIDALEDYINLAEEVLSRIKSKAAAK